MNRSRKFVKEEGNDNRRQKRLFRHAIGADL